jgi:hypothetical protein
MTASSMYLTWLGLVLLGAVGSGLWGRAGQVALALGTWLSLVATIIVLVGLRKVTAPQEDGAGRASNGSSVLLNEP